MACETHQWDNWPDGCHCGLWREKKTVSILWRRQTHWTTKMLGETSILLTVFTVDTKTEVYRCGKLLVPPPHRAPLCRPPATLHLSFQPSSHSPPFISIPPSLPFCLCYVWVGDLSVIYSLDAVCVFMECHSLCSASQLLILVRETKRSREALKFNDVAGILGDLLFSRHRDHMTAPEAVRWKSCRDVSK